MEKRNFWKLISRFETGVSAAEWVWRIGTALLIGASSIATGLLAEADPILGQFGPVLWAAVGIVTAFFLVVILYFFRAANLKKAQADLHRAMDIPKSGINPLLDTFRDLVIPIEDLRLPTMQLHKNKHFKRCKFVGPGAVAIQGGTYKNFGFIECGDIVALPDNVMLTGIIVLDNCTVEECEFIRMTVFADQFTARLLADVPGAEVKGLKS